VTEKGGIGIGSLSMKPGDQVCMLFGGKTMFVLKPLIGTDTHLFIGPYYLNGVMKEEILDMVAAGELSTQ
jgi:hypothetical protein